MRFKIVFATLISLMPVSMSANEKPNIVIILADDMGYGDIHHFNRQSRIPTPHLDRLASNGMTFEDAHSPSAVCTPTRYGLVTGRYCWRSSLKRGVLGGYSPPLLGDSQETIGSMLKNAGYATGAIGKWHLGMAMPFKSDAEKKGDKWAGDPGIDFGGQITNSPIHHGFDYYFGVSASLDMAPYVYVRNDRFTLRPTIQQPAVKFPYFVRNGPRAADFEIDGVLDRLTSEAVEFISKSSSGDKPFFLYLPLTAPHKPTQPHPRFRGKTKLGEYGDFIGQVDWTVGQVIGAIAKSGETDNTVVMFTSDNGSYMHRYEGERKDHLDDPSIQGFRSENHKANGMLRGTKADVWEAGHRVPLLVSWPGTVAAGSAQSATVCHTDMFETCAEIVGVNLDNQSAQDSFSFLPALKGKTYERPVPVIHHSANGTFAIRKGAWKLVLSSGSGGREKPAGKPFGKPYTLFDLEKDISEKSDVALSNPGVVADLERMFRAIQSRGRSVDRTGSANQ